MPYDINLGAFIVVQQSALSIMTTATEARTLPRVWRLAMVMKWGLEDLFGLIPDIGCGMGSAICGSGDLEQLLLGCKRHTKNEALGSLRAGCARRCGSDETHSCAPRLLLHLDARIGGLLHLISCRPHSLLIMYTADSR